MIKSKNIAIIIPTNGNDTIKKTLLSVYKQKVEIGQVIVCSTKVLNIQNYKKKKNFYFLLSSKNNQVYQRSLALKYLKKKIKILLFLDDKIILQKNSLKSLTQNWNKSGKDVAGIGMSCKNYQIPKVNFFHKLTITNHDKIGKILKSGFVSGYGKVNKNTRVEWLNGGMSSWKLKIVRKYLNRVYPMISWSVAEDLIFSLNFQNKFKLILSSTSFCKISNIIQKRNIKDSFIRGFLHAKVINSITSNNKYFSKPLFYYSIFLSSLIGILFNFLTINVNEISRFAGRFIGGFFKYKKIN